MTRARDLASGLNGIRPFATAGNYGTTPSGTTATVTFPAGRFTQIPGVTTAINSGATAPAPLLVTAISTSSFSIGSYNGTSWLVVGFWWNAFQMTPTTMGG
jgi:hypothetical protein